MNDELFDKILLDPDQIDDLLAFTEALHQTLMRDDDLARYRDAYAADPDFTEALTNHFADRLFKLTEVAYRLNED